MAKILKKRHWAFVLYPESAPENWREILIQTGLPFAVSPLHDKDVNPDNTPKKPHYHIILIYGGPTSFNVVKRITDALKQPIPIPLEQVKGYYRYFTHKDNPEKAQYDERDISVGNGFDICEFSELTRSEILEIKKSIIALLIEKNFLEFSEMIEYFFENGMSTELDIASCNTFFFEKFITSRRHRFERIKTDDRLGVKIDSLTGEILD